MLFRSLGSFVKEPEKKMALGGAVAFDEGSLVPDIDRIKAKLASGQPLTPDEQAVLNVKPVLQPNAIMNTAAQSDNRDMASRMQLGAPQTDNVQTKYGTTVPAGGIAQNPAVQQPAEERAHVDTAQEEIAKLRSLMGESSYAKDVEKRLADREARINKADDRSLGMALDRKSTRLNSSH